MNYNYGLPAQAGQTNNAISKGDVYVSLSDKAEKITTALYMVTDGFEIGEPLRERLRAVGIRFIALGTICRGNNLAVSHGALLEIAGLAREARALVSLANVVDLISDMNATILKNELAKLVETVEGHTPVLGNTENNHNKKSVVFPDDFFAPGFGGPSIAPQQDIHKGQQIDKGQHEYMSFMKQEQKSQPENVSLSKDIKDKKFDVAHKINRKNSIIQIIKDKKEVTIKDIANIISDCSEKTIQRELGLLVGQGVLRREGDKRWSKYRIA